jgi:predicted secreted Zn-dependent protease
MEQSRVSKVLNRVIHSKERDIIRKVIEHCDEEKCMHGPIQKSTAAHYTGLGKVTRKSRMTHRKHAGRNGEIRIQAVSIHMCNIRP